MIIKPEFLDGNIPLLEYPRPQFKRDSYLSFNGDWDYAITKSNNIPSCYDGKIIVPYSPESSLSGVNRQLKADEFLYYKKDFTLPDGFNKGKILLNIGACDQVTEVYINGSFAGRHEGGYLSFTVDVSEYLVNEQNQLVIKVTDDASSDIYGRGKQKYKRGGIWYTATSGIWQSVFLESVPDKYIQSVKLLPDFDKKTLILTCFTNYESSCLVEIYDGEKFVCKKKIFANEESEIYIPDCKEWATDSPEIYTIIFTMGKDRVQSYFGMRKFSSKMIDGKKYFTLNDEPIFHNGLLDQGYWHDGIYTPKTNKKMYDEILALKNMGFNMLRKHIKVEPMLWYYYCDILGMLVWQDMINGGGEYPFYRIALCPFFDLKLDDTNYKKMRRSSASRDFYYKEAYGLIDQLYNVVSLCLWTPFNEAWGQFDGVTVWRKLSTYDSSRLFDHASGWQDRGVGDLNSRHIYFRKIKLKNDGKRIMALTEFGGYSYAMPNHVFAKKLFGYKGFKKSEDLTSAYEDLYKDEIFPAIKNDGLGATVYTQVSDVEDEVNGLYTYDRVLKVDENKIKKINEELYITFNKIVNKS